LDRKALEQVLGGDEAAFAALGCDRLLGFLEPEIDGRFRQSVSLMSGLARNGDQCTKRSGRVTGASPRALRLLGLLPNAPPVALELRELREHRVVLRIHHWIPRLQVLPQ